MALEGKSNETVARILQERKVLIPMAYWQEKGYRRSGKVTQPNKYRWCKTTVTKILTQQEYCGDIINFKTYSKSYKNKKRYDNPKANWVIFKGVHEPIIDRESFGLVVKTKRRAPKEENGEKNMFCDFLYCADCGVRYGIIPIPSTRIFTISVAPTTRRTQEEIANPAIISVLMLLSRWLCLNFAFGKVS